MDFELLIRVYRYFSDGRQEVAVGTAYPIAPERILTARHVLAEEQAQIVRDKLEITWFYHACEDGSRFRSDPDEIEVEWDGLTDGAGIVWDAAVLKCSFPEGVTVPPRILSDLPPKHHNEWRSRGFPEIGRRGDDLSPTDLLGKTGGCQKTENVFQVMAEAGAGAAQGWSGVSGAPVFVGGSIVGLIIEACELTKGNRINAIPMFRLLQIPSFRKAVRLPSLNETAAINTNAFKAKIIAILEKSPETLALLEEKSTRAEFRGKPISVPCGDPAPRNKAAHITENLFKDFDCGQHLLRHAIGDCVAAKQEAQTQILQSIVCLFFPACFARDDSAQILTEYRRREEALIDARAASVPSAELRMAAIEERTAQFDDDQTRSDGPIGKKKIHDPPPFALEAMRDEQFQESLAKLLYEKTFSSRKFRFEKYAQFRELINKNLEVGKYPDGAPYLILLDPEDGRNSGFTKEELKKISEELMALYPHIMIMAISESSDIIARDLDCLEWFWKIFKKG